MRLNEQQAESFELLYANISNALMYAEDMFNSGNTDLKHTISPVINKLKWTKNYLEMGIPHERRDAVREQDTLYYDVISRAVTGMTDEQRERLEDFINNKL